MSTLKKVPFGLAQAPAHFQQLINEILKGLPLLLDIWTASSSLIKPLKKILNI